MALSDFKGSEPLYVLLAAALTGIVVKTTVDRAPSAETTVAKAASDKRPSAPPGKETKNEAKDEGLAGDVPGQTVPEPGMEVVTVLRRDLGAPVAGACAPHGGRVTSLGTVIALLPDPATSGFVEEVDNGLEAILQSAQSQGYTVYRHDLPWQRDGATLSGRAEAGRAGWVVMRQDLPDATYRLLLILVVGERLGLGVERAMLQNALQIQHTLDPNGPLLILGPYFSGTAASLRQGLEAWCANGDGPCKGRRAAIISGTATRLLNTTILDATAGLAVRFQATVNPDDALSAAMHEFLRSALGIGTDEVAELTETSTAFGVAHADTEARSSRAAGGAATKTGEARVPLRISYPAHLTDGPAPDATPATPPAFRDGESSVDVVPVLAPGTLTESRQVVTGTIEALRRRGISEVGVLATSSRDKILLVTALRAAAPDIRPHVYEANLTLADPVQHGAMDGTLAASSYPVASATQLWAGRRDVQPFTSDASEGIYNALLALLWDGGFIADDVLAAGLRDYRQPFHAAGDAAAGGRTVRGADLDRVGPPIWISVVVGGSVWPLAVYQFNWKHTGWKRANSYVFGRVDDEPSAQALCPPGGAAKATNGTNGTKTPAPLILACAPQPEPRLARGRYATVVLVMLLVLVAGNLLGLVRRMAPLRRCPFMLFYDGKDEESGPTPWPPPSAPLESPPAKPPFLYLETLRDPDARPPVWLGTLVLSLSGLAAGLLYEFPLLLTNASLDVSDAIAGLLIVGALLLLLSPFYARPDELGAGNEAGLWQRASHRSHRLRWAVHAILVGGAAFAAIWILVLFTRQNARSDGRAFFFFARLMNPSLGLTPALPLGVMATALYAACLFRLRVVRRGRRLLLSAGRWAGDAVPGAEAGMLAFAQASLHSMERILWLGAVLGVGLFAWHRIRPRSLEGSSFDFVVAVSFGLTFAVAVASMWRADRLWRMLARYLRGLAVHPWSAAFSSLPQSIAQTFRTPMPGRLRHDEVERAHAVAVALAAETPLGPPPGKDASAPAAVAPEGHSTPDYLAALTPWWKAPGVRPPALGPNDDAHRPLAVQLREHALALRMTEALSQMCDATRTTLFIGSGSAVAAVLATAIYPFQPAGTLAWAARLAIGVVVLVSLRVIGGIERDELLSHLGGTAPGKMTPSWSLALRLVGYVVVPLATLAAAHLPDHGLLSGLLHALNGAPAVLQP
jgi:hypothetical protein